MPIANKSGVTQETGSGYPEHCNLGSRHYHARQMSDADGLNAFSDEHHFTQRYGTL